jgi:hypothetical protein
LNRVDRVFFADSWQGFFAESGFTSFDDFMDYSGGEIVNVNNRRNVVKFAVRRGAETRVFYMKRFIHPHFKDMLFTWHAFGGPCSQARYEWENARFLLDNGIEAYRPLCYGQRTKFGMERKSFVITEELAARSLDVVAAENWTSLERGTKESIIAGMAAFVRRIHALNVSLPDLYVWHIFLRETDAKDEYDFAVIDLHRMSRNVKDRTTQVGNLGRLHHSMIDKYFDEELKELLIEAYAGDDWPGKITRLAAHVKKRSRAISARRRPKPY